MTPLLFVVTSPAIFRYGIYVRIRMDGNIDVCLVGIVVDKKVIITRFDVHMSVEALSSEKEGFQVRKISSHSHISIALKSVGKITHSRMGGFKAYKLVQESRRSEERRVGKERGYR